MIPAPYTNFLVASTQASAALIGLLFVSISIAPGRVFGREAQAGRRVLALTSFTALANAFFVSFGSLVPNVPLGALVVVPGVLAVSQTLFLLRLVPDWRRERTVVRGLALFAVSGSIYGLEIVIGFRLWSAPTDTAALTALLELLLGTYAIGLARAWELLGASHRRGIATGALGWLQARLRAQEADKNEVESSPDADQGP
jgi:hypothetical protein